MKKPVRIPPLAQRRTRVEYRGGRARNAISHRIREGNFFDKSQYRSGYKAVPGADAADLADLGCGDLPGILAAQAPELRQAVDIARRLKANLSVSHIALPADKRPDVRPASCRNKQL